LAGVFIDEKREHVHLNGMHIARLSAALARLNESTQEVQAILAEMRKERDPLAAHIFTSRRDYAKTSDTKSGKRHALKARSTYIEACQLGFRGRLDEWERLLGAAAPR
jgi:hypothetical protein